MRTKLLRLAAWLLRKYFVGKRLYRIVSLDGFPSVQDYGKIIGVAHSNKTGRITVSYIDGRKFPRTVDLSLLRREKLLKNEWAYND